MNTNLSWKSSKPIAVSIEIAGCIYRILRPSLIFLLEEGRNATQVEVVLKLEKKLEIF